MAGQTSIYDRIGENYRANRRPDPRIAELIQQALDNAASVLNVGAGTGSYEPGHAKVVAVEPSRVMIDQRPAGAAPVVRGMAEDLPFAAKSFQASMAILTLHHWSDIDKGLQELMRIAKQRVVILTWDPDSRGFWLCDDYFPELDQVHNKLFPKLSYYEKVLGNITVKKVPIPHDCTDGFLCAYWRRPRAYLEPSLRSSMSVFSKIQNESEGVEALRNDLASGRWEKRNAEILGQDSLDLGYRLIIKQL